MQLQPLPDISSHNPFEPEYRSKNTACPVKLSSTVMDLCVTNEMSHHINAGQTADVAPFQHRRRKTYKRRYPVFFNGHEQIYECPTSTCDGKKLYIYRKVSAIPVPGCAGP
jgi:hypothetical protein